MAKTMSLFVARGGNKGWQVCAERDDGSVYRLTSHETEDSARKEFQRQIARFKKGEWYRGC